MTDLTMAGITYLILMIWGWGNFWLLLRYERQKRRLARLAKRGGEKYRRLEKAQLRVLWSAVASAIVLVATFRVENFVDRGDVVEPPLQAGGFRIFIN